RQSTVNLPRVAIGLDTFEPLAEDGNAQHREPRHRNREEDLDRGGGPRLHDEPVDPAEREAAHPEAEEGPAGSALQAVVDVIEEPIPGFLGDVAPLKGGRSAPEKPAHGVELALAGRAARQVGFEVALFFGGEFTVEVTRYQDLV